ncbi:MAG: hypothetical protein ACRYFZ_00630 [Janthinobacterium lividum]
MATAPSVQLFPAQVAAVASYLLANPEQARAYGLAPAESGVPLAADAETRTYHLGTEPTGGRGYDDRLTVRLGLSRSTIMAELTLWREYGGKRGGLRHMLGGTKYWVSEQACREWMGDRKAAA